LSPAGIILAQAPTGQGNLASTYTLGASFMECEHGQKDIFVSQVSGWHVQIHGFLFEQAA